MLSSGHGDASIEGQRSAPTESPQAKASVPVLRSSTTKSFQTTCSEGVLGVEGLSSEPSEKIHLDSVLDAHEISARTGQAFRLHSPEQLSSSMDAMWSDRPVRNGEALLSDESEFEVAERKRWQEWARHAAEHERQRRIKV